MKIDTYECKGIASLVEKKLNEYFADLNGQEPAVGLYHQVIKEVEIPLIKLALQNAKGNKLKAANILGINRNTLAKKMAGYNI